MMDFAQIFRVDVQLMQNKVLQFYVADLARLETMCGKLEWADSVPQRAVCLSYVWWWISNDSGCPQIRGQSKVQSKKLLLDYAYEKKCVKILRNRSKDELTFYMSVFYK